jgi:hypothetical protein
MIVECNWYAHFPEKTNTEWIALSWQTNGYLFRTSKERAELYDVFDTNKDKLITMRAGDTYSAVLNSEIIGLHFEQAQGLSDSVKLDFITPLIRGQVITASYVLGVGLPRPIGILVLTNDSFQYRLDEQHRTVSGIIEVGLDNLIKGIVLTNNGDAYTLTNEAGETIQEKGFKTPISLQYGYGGTDQPAWFPHEMMNTAIINDKLRSIYHLKVHHLELGVVPVTEFFPQRFIGKQSPNKIINSNGVSFVTMNGVTKPAFDGSDSQIKEIENHNGARVFFIGLMCMVTLMPILIIIRWRKMVKT